MRTTIDIPDPLFRRTKATAAARGITLRQLVVESLQRDITPPPKPPTKGKRRLKLPEIHLEPGRILDLTNFDFDDLLT
jgi:hypothetical protein